MTAGFRELFASPAVIKAYVMNAAHMVAGFAVIVNLPAFMQLNLGYPRARFGLLYLVGGLVSFASMRVAGRAIDRVGSFVTGATGSGLFALIVLTYLGVQLRGPVELLFTVFMVSMALRNVAAQTLNSKVPLPHERARFLSLLSTVIHVSSSAGAFAAANLLTTRADGSLEGVPRVAALSVTLTLLAPLVMRSVERLVRARNAPTSAEPQLA
jgi:predicted MFS family arabinose efflux permease